MAFAFHFWLACFAAFFFALPLHAKPEVDPETAIEQMTTLFKTHFSNPAQGDLVHGLLQHLMYRSHPLTTREEAIEYYHFILNHLATADVEGKEFIEASAPIYQALKPDFEAFKKGYESCVAPYRARTKINQQAFFDKIGRNYLGHFTGPLANAKTLAEFEAAYHHMSFDPMFGGFEKERNAIADERFSEVLRWSPEKEFIHRLYGGKRVNPVQLAQVKDPSLFLALLKDGLEHHVWDSPKKLSRFLDLHLPGFYAAKPGPAQLTELSLLLSERPVPTHRSFATARALLSPEDPTASLSDETGTRERFLNVTDEIFKESHFFDEQQKPDFVALLARLSPSRDVAFPELKGKANSEFLAAVIHQYSSERDAPRAGEEASNRLLVRWLKQLEEKYPDATTRRAIAEELAEVSHSIEGNIDLHFYRTSFLDEDELTKPHLRLETRFEVVEHLSSKIGKDEKANREAIQDFFSQYRGPLTRMFPDDSTDAALLISLLAAADRRQNESSASKAVAELIVYLDPSLSDIKKLGLHTALGPEIIQDLSAHVKRAERLKKAVGLRPARGAERKIKLEPIPASLSRKGLDDYVHSAFAAAEIPGAKTFHEVFEATEGARKQYFPEATEAQFITEMVKAAALRGDTAQGSVVEWTLAALKVYSDSPDFTRLQDLLFSFPVEFKGGSREAGFERAGFYPDRSLGKQTAKTAFINHLIEFLAQTDQAFTDDEIAKLTFDLTKTGRSTFYPDYHGDMKFLYEIAHEIKRSKATLGKRNAALRTLTQVMYSDHPPQIEADEANRILAAKPLSRWFPSNRRIRAAVLASTLPRSCDVLEEVGDNDE